MTTVPTPSRTAKAIETRYAGHRFRSRLEARWAVFFDALGAAWQYEPQGFVIDGRPYLPDFLLTDSGTWVEVKGDPATLDVPFMFAAAEQLPAVAPSGGESAHGLLLLGPIPHPRQMQRDANGVLDLAHLHIATEWRDAAFSRRFPRTHLQGMRAGFGSWAKNRRPWFISTYDDGAPCECMGCLTPPLALTPSVSRDDEHMREVTIAAYEAARTARFEHGESGR